MLSRAGTDFLKSIASSKEFGQCFTNSGLLVLVLVLPGAFLIGWTYFVRSKQKYMVGEGVRLSLVCHPLCGIH